tara:strand:+ start:457 stop:618 length:162 start_codon:yes stop_codon:yes gene_type:complete
MITHVSDEFKDVVKTHFSIKKTEIKKTVGIWYNETVINKNNFNQIISKMINLF